LTATEIVNRTIDPKFGERPVHVKEYTLLEPVPHINSSPNPDGGPLIASTEVKVTQYQFENAGLVVKRGPDGKPFELSIQASDQYGYQREFSVKVERKYDPATSVSTWHWMVRPYQHPFHRLDTIQETTKGKALRFIERLVDLAEKYPSLMFNNAAFTEHTPPHFRPRHEGFVRWHTLLLNGAEFSVKLLD
jgi:hypothetical protein